MSPSPWFILGALDIFIIAYYFYIFSIRSQEWFRLNLNLFSAPGFASVVVPLNQKKNWISIQAGHIQCRSLDHFLDGKYKILLWKFVKVKPCCYDYDFYTQFVKIFCVFWVLTYAQPLPSAGLVSELQMLTSSFLILTSVACEITL